MITLTNFFPIRPPLFLNARFQDGPELLDRVQIPQIGRPVFTYMNHRGQIRTYGLRIAIHGMTHHTTRDNIQFPASLDGIVISRPSISITTAHSHSLQRQRIFSLNCIQHLGPHAAPRDAHCGEPDLVANAHGLQGQQVRSRRDHQEIPRSAELTSQNHVHEIADNGLCFLGS
jgi:hypothetical protein